MRYFVGIDALIRERVAPESYWLTVGSRIDKRLKILTRPLKVHKEDLTFDKAVQLFVEKFLSNQNTFRYCSMKSTRPGIDDTSARLLTERCVRQDQGLTSLFTFLWKIYFL